MDHENHSDPPTSAAPRLRGEATIELFTGFLEEGTDGLDKVDGILMAIEQEGLDRGKVDALFRVFHTIKGVAGCLEIADVVEVAHTTETMLGRVREGEWELTRDRIDLVFASADLLRRLLGTVRTSVEHDTAVPHDDSIHTLLERFSQASVTSGLPKPRLSITPKAPPPPVVSETPAAAPVPPEVKAEVKAPEPVVEKEPTPTEKEAVAAQNGQGAGRLRETVKVDLERIDAVVDMIGELIIVEAMVVNAPEVAAIASLKVRNSLSQLTKISRDLQDVAMRMRMVPVRGVFQKIAKMTRELSRMTGKDVQFVTSGESVEMDRSMVERIEDPLVHMIRNSMDHGIEPAADRVASGKPARGTLRLAAYHQGGSIVVEIADDGRGLQREAILKKARAQGLIRDGEALTDNDVFALIFLPGFSTAAQVTEISGRGVGMDVVKRSIEGLRGRVSVTSEPGKGTTFRLVLPLTLAIIDGMLVSCAGETYIVPSLSIAESMQPTPGSVRSMADRGEIIDVRGDILPLIRLRRLFDLPGDDPDISQSRVVIVESMGKRIGLLIDDVLTQQQVVIKPLSNSLGDTAFLAGAAILSDGRVGLILNVDRLGELLGGHQYRAPVRALGNEVHP